MKIAFFGVGAVGVVMARALFELCHKNALGTPSFVFVVRSKERAEAHFFRNPELLECSTFVEVEDFEGVFKNPDAYAKTFKKCDALINASVPSFNLPIMELSLAYGAHYADLASDIYTKTLLKTQRFSQQDHAEAFEEKGLFGLINLGISPGVSNFLIGERIAHFHNFPYKTRVKKITLALLEEICSKELVFSWAPHVAIEEISFKPAYFKNHALETLAPFSESKTYAFPYFQNSVEVYPVFQEEVISLKQSFPEVPEIRIHVGGNEVELMKNLYQLNLLSNRYCYGYKDSEISLSSIIKEVIPKMKSPEAIEEYIHNGTIKHAQFCAVADLTLEVRYPNNPKRVTSSESVGVSFSEVTSLVKTPFSGATYISYPTGIGAAVLLFHGLMYAQTHPLKGVLATEALPQLFGPALCDIIKRELGSYKLNLFHAITS